MNTAIAIFMGIGVMSNVPPAPGVDGTVAATPASISAVSVNHEVYGGCADDCVSGCVGGACQGLCDGLFGCCHGMKMKVSHNTTGDMLPHYAYPPRFHGYYYYRPYNYILTLNHQLEALEMAGDPRAPYASKVFERIYAEFDAAAYDAPNDGRLLPSPSRTSTALPDLIETLD